MLRKTADEADGVARVHRRSRSAGDVSQAEATEGPDSTAVRVALWRALHIEIDPPPYVIEDEIGLALIDPGPAWRRRPDMNPRYTSRARASIVARARFIEDLVTEEAARGVGQYVLLGAGLDTFAQRRPEIASQLEVFEVDLPGPQAWKRRRLREVGFAVPEWLHFVAVDFEKAWWEKLATAGFDANRPTVVSSSGVVMYLSREATTATLARIGELAAGSTLAMSFMLPVELVEAGERRVIRGEHEQIRASAPAASLFSPDELLALVREAGFKQAQRVAASDLAARYFSGRPDDLRPSSAEELITATT
jgi:methyltransferase (TIGR00027 family)